MKIRNRTFIENRRGFHHSDVPHRPQALNCECVPATHPHLATDNSNTNHTKLDFRVTFPKPALTYLFISFTSRVETIYSNRNYMRIPDTEMTSYNFILTW